MTMDRNPYVKDGLHLFWLPWERKQPNTTLKQTHRGFHILDMIHANACGHDGLKNSAFLPHTKKKIHGNEHII